MKNEEIMRRLDHFKDLDPKRNFHRVCIKSGYAHATDGRIAVKWKLEESAEPSIPENYPIDRLIEIIGESGSVEAWHKISCQDYDSAKEKFLESFRKAIADEKHDMEDRYKFATCPCCREDLYWDTWTDSLVVRQEAEFHRLSKPKEVNWPVCLRFASGECRQTVVGFGYLMTIVLGLDGLDLVFGMCKRNANGAMNKLAFKSIDGSVEGMLMPLYHTGDSYEGCNCEIAMLPA